MIGVFFRALECPFCHRGFLFQNWIHSSCILEFIIQAIEWVRSWWCWMRRDWIILLSTTASSRLQLNQRRATVIFNFELHDAHIQTERAWGPHLVRTKHIFRNLSPFIVQSDKTLQNFKHARFLLSLGCIPMPSRSVNSNNTYVFFSRKIWGTGDSCVFFFQLWRKSGEI